MYSEKVAAAKLQGSNTVHYLGLAISTDMKYSDYLESIATSTARKVS